jgi:hypothetical protein
MEPRLCGIIHGMETTGGLLSLFSQETAMLEHTVPKLGISMPSLPTSRACHTMILCLNCVIQCEKEQMPSVKRTTDSRCIRMPDLPALSADPKGADQAEKSTIAVFWIISTKTIPCACVDC